MVDIVRELILIIDEVSQKNMVNAKTHNENLYKLMDESKKIKLKILEEIASVGTLLVNREGFLKLIFELEKITDNAEACAYRIMYIVDGKLKSGITYLKELSKFSSLVLDEVTKLRDIMIALMFNPEKALELSKIVEAKEKEIDIAHRQFDLKLLKTEKKFPLLLLIRDIAERVEDISDIGVDSVDLLRTLAIYG